MRNCNYIGVFYALLQAGLWEKDVQLLQYGRIDFNEVIQLTEEQSVVGLVTTGLEHVIDTKVSHDCLLPFIGRTLQIERKNKAMNEFIGKLINLLNEKGIKAVLVKGQGVAQCYERPLWRACGDVDLLLDDENYQKAKSVLSAIASNIETEGVKSKHLGMTINNWKVELHGTLYSEISNRIDRGLDEIKNAVFKNTKTRLWMNGNTQVHLQGIDEDIAYVFTHILQHFYKGGIGLRQICDWCRLLWTNSNAIDVKLLEKRLRKMGIISQWKAFGVFAVEYLGMPIKAMPLINEGDSKKNNMKKKAERICAFIMEVGNFGHNRDFTYYQRYPYVVRKALSFAQRCNDLWTHARIFPFATLKFTPTIMFNGIVSAIRGE